MLLRIALAYAAALLLPRYTLPLVLLLLVGTAPPGVVHGAARRRPGRDASHPPAAAPEGSRLGPRQHRWPLPRRFGLPRPALELGFLPPLLLVLVVGQLDRRPRAPQLPQAGIAVQVEGWIAAAPERAGSRDRALLEIEHVASLAVAAGDSGSARFASPRWRGRRILAAARRPLPIYGKRCRIGGVLRAARTPRDFHGFDEAMLLEASGADGVLEVQVLDLLPGARGPAWRRELLEPLRARLAATLHAVLAPHQAGLLAALVLGRRDGVDTRTSDAWRALGLSHIISISGMHVGLVAGALLALCGSPQRRRGLVGLLAGIWIYAALGGLGPTVLRSTWMATWGALALYLGRPRQPLRVLGLASLLLVLESPARRHDVGLQLSCVSTLGLLVWAPVLLRLGRRLAESGRGGRAAAWALGSGGIGIAAQAATLPLVLWHFGMLSWSAPLANLIFVPLTDLALMIGLAGAPVTLLCAFLGRPLLLLSGALLYAGEVASHALVGALDTCFFLRVDAATVAGAALVAAAVLLAGTFGAAGRRRRAAVAGGIGLVAATALGWIAAHPGAPTWQLEALDVGQGDALVLRVGTATWLVDTGDASPSDCGARVVVPHLRRAGVRRLRGLVLTHPHDDHCGGAAAVLRALRVDTLYVARASALDSTYATLHRLAPRQPWRALRAGERLDLAPDYEATVLWPDSADVLGSGGNGCSLVLWARGPGHPDVLLTGDLEANGEARLLERWRAPLAAAASGVLVLKAGHHGSITSSSPTFLDAVQPELVLLSVGARNRYGHPSARTLAAFETRACTLLRTDRGGSVRLQQRGATLWLERPAQRARAVVLRPWPG